MIYNSTGILKSTHTTKQNKKYSTHFVFGFLIIVTFQLGETSFPFSM